MYMQDSSRPAATRNKVSNRYAQIPQSVMHYVPVSSLGWVKLAPKRCVGQAWFWGRQFKVQAAHALMDIKSTIMGKRSSEARFPKPLNDERYRSDSRHSKIMGCERPFQPKAVRSSFPSIRTGAWRTNRRGPILEGGKGNSKRCSFSKQCIFSRQEKV
jgi:hypothetical protein